MSSAPGGRAAPAGAVGPAAAEATIYEFHNQSLDHYFRTANQAEAAAVDGGSAGPGWLRTGDNFVAYALAGYPAGAREVCRFYGSVTPGPNSHFYTADPAECQQLKAIQAAAPPGAPRWNYEELAFAIDLPVASICPARAPVPVYRAYNNGPARGVDSNHRYTTDLAAYGGVIARGWSDEGIVMCAIRADTVPAARPASVERDVPPLATDPAIGTSTEAHVAINPAAAVVPAGRLLVFLPGTGGLPDQYRLILRSGAARGFHAIGLNYPNPTAVGTLCKDSADANCYWDVRREVITGVDFSTLVAVGVSDSIVNRLQKAIAWLDSRYPAEGWGQYLAAGAVDWARVVMAGHSQGGGHAGVMAKLYPLGRAVYFSSPADWNNVTRSPAAWAGTASATPVSKQYGFAHLQDTLVPWSELAAIWKSLGLSSLGAAVSVDAAAPPFAGSHQLTTNAAPNTGSGALFPYHSATVVDAATPRTVTGAPAYDAVWSYLCFD